MGFRLTGRPQTLATAGALGLILILAGALRIWGIGYGLPHPTARPDEERIVGRAFTILATGNLDPVDFAYPSLLLYLNALALGAYVKAGQLLGHYRQLWDFLFASAVTHPGLPYRVCRAVSLSLGVATVGATYALARNGYGSRAVGLLAALTVATSYLHVRDSRFATVDVAMTFFSTLSLVFAVKAGEGHRLLHYLLAGVFAGLAASTKYNAGLVILAVVAAGLAGLFRRREEARARSIPGKLLLSALAMALAFALTSPYVLLHYQAVARDFAWHGRKLYASTGERALWTHLRVTFPEGLGWPFFLLATAGTIRAVRLRRGADLILLVFVATTLAAVSSVRIVFPRYLLPLVPPLAVLAAEQSLSILPRSRRPALGALAAVALAGPGLVRSVQFDRLAARKDTRILAVEWVDENLPRRSTILLCRGYGAPAINADRRRPPAFDPQPIDCSTDEVRKSGARYLITHEHPRLHNYSRIPVDLRRLLEEHGRPLAVFNPFREGREEETYFYAADAFYIPFSGLGAVERGGPVITVWALGQSP